MKAVSGSSFHFHPSVSFLLLSQFVFQSLINEIWNWHSLLKSTLLYVGSTHLACHNVTWGVFKLYVRDKQNLTISSFVENKIL